MDKYDHWILIPAYNEALNLGNVISELHEYGFRKIIVIDDGSKDETSQIARSLDCNVVRHSINLGVGAAIRTGLLWAKMNDIPVVIQVDGDGQHSPSSIEAITKVKEADLVVGCRNWENYEFGFSRKLAKRVLIGALGINGVKGVPDPTSGFRLYGPNAIDVLSRTMPTNFLGDTVESLIVANSYKLVIKTTQVEIRNRNEGLSSHTGLRIANALFSALAYTMSYKTRRWKNV